MKLYAGYVKNANTVVEKLMELGEIRKKRLPHRRAFPPFQFRIQRHAKPRAVLRFAFRRRETAFRRQRAGQKTCRDMRLSGNFHRRFPERR